MNINDQIQDLIDNNEIVIFMKGTPDMPMCGFSNVVVQIFATLQTKFIGVNVLEDQNLRQGIKDFSDWPTIPQIYVKGEFIGGCDIIREMYSSGELQDLLKSKALNSVVTR